MKVPDREQMLTARFNEYGIDGLFPDEAVELLLYLVHVKDARAVSAHLMRHYKTVWNLFNSTVGELRRVEGMNESIARMISCVGNISERGQSQYERQTALTCPRRAARLLAPRLRGMENEVVLLVCLDSQLLPISVTKVSDGEERSAKVDLFNIVSDARDVASYTVIMAHNHPAGNPNASYADIEVTTDTAKKLVSVGIELLDHLVIAGDEFVSLAVEGVLKTMDPSGRAYLPAVRREAAL